MIILRVWAKQPGNYFCISSKSPNGEWRDEFFTRKQFKMVPRYLKELNDDGCDVYWCPHGFSKARRLKRYAVPPYLLWADIDEVDLSTIPLKPSIAWESSPGRYAGLWTLNKVLDDDEVNKRWTYHIGADRGGWDLTQVLRVPGTRNHKYKEKPVVKLLWDDPRIVYDLKRDILPALPQARKRKTDEERSKNARQIFTKYKKHLTPWARREILQGKPTKGKRSEVFWKLTNELIEAGAEEDESFILLWASPWNKFAGRRDGEDQLHREINKVYDNKFSGPEGQIDYEEDSDIKREEEAERQNDISSIFLAAAEEEDPDWILYPYFARGHITTVEGSPEVGKSWFCMAAAAAIAECKKPFPQDGWDHKNERGLVLYFDSENMSGQVMRRMSDSGMLTPKQSHHEAAPFMHIPPEVFSPQLGDPDIIEEMDTFIDEIKSAYRNTQGYDTKVSAIIFDTLVNYSGVTDSNKQGDVIQIMNNLKELAVHLNCSVVAIRHHSKNLKDKDPMHRGVGSIQYGASARIVIGVYQHPDDESSRVVTLGKNSLAQKHWVRPLVYSLEHVFPGATDVKKRDRSRMVWSGFADISDSDLVISQKEKDERRKEHKKDLEIFAEMMEELENEHRINGHAAKIPMSDIRAKLNQTNIPDKINRSRVLKQMGYKPQGRGKNTYYVKDDG